jgi:SCY1-like protein 1
MQSSYKRLVNPNPKARVSIGHFLEQGQRSGSFFDSPLIKLTDGVDNLGVKTEEERNAFLEYVFDFSFFFFFFLKPFGHLVLMVLVTLTN